MRGQDIDAILADVDFVDEIYFGGWNYNRHVSEFPGLDEFYEEQARKVERFCRTRGIELAA